MTQVALNVRHIDLASAEYDQAPSDRAALTVYWWDALPLGLQLSSAAELPQSPATLAQLRVRFAAEQRTARDPTLHTPLLAGSEGRPERALTLADARKAEGSLAWLRSNAEPAKNAAHDLSVIVCTRDRGNQLAACLDAILAQNSPPGELIVVDNSGDGNAAAICRAIPGAIYVHEPRAGLSHARNAGVLTATRPFIAFTDDDVSPHAAWTAEVMRAFALTEAEAVTGLVLPIRLETSAQRCFQINMGGFGERFQPVLFNDHFFKVTGAGGAHVWRIGAGANMAFRRSVFDRVGLFDSRLGAGASGCSEDSEIWYRILAPEQPNNPNTRFVTGDACDLPFEDASFDIATMFDLLEHVPDDHKAASEAMRVVKRGGAILVSTPDAEWRYPYYGFMTSLCPHEQDLMDEWGHVRRGYRAQDLNGLFGGEPFTRASFINGVTAFYHDVAFSKLGKRKRKLLYAAMAAPTAVAYALHGRSTKGTEHAAAWRR